MPPTVHPKGTTIYRPEDCCNGYNLVLRRGDDGTDVALVDMNGNPVHRWPMQGGGWVPRARLGPDGVLLVLRSGGDDARSRAQQYDWDGELVWEYAPPEGLRPHHDVSKTADGSVLMICRETVPEEVRRRAKEPERREMLYADVIQEVSPDNQVVWQWHQYEHLDINRRVKVPASFDWRAGPKNNTLFDWAHTNTVQALPENRWHEGGDERFKPGNVLMSLRQLDLLLIVDRDSREIVWRYEGDYKGGLSGQHDSHMIEKGLPGAGNIIVFDNGSSPTENLAHCGCSFVLEIKPTTKEVEWVYDDGERFHSNFTSSCQRMPNGNTLILEAAHHRFFEVTPEGEVVWEHIWPDPETPQRAYRYPYDYCPQMASLEPPEETAVTPDA